MAQVLSQEIEGKKAVSGKLGKQILDVITSGMYSDPRMSIREFIQNSADSIDIAESTGVIDHDDGKIVIMVDGKNRCITIEDNGLGVAESDVDERLGSLGCSSKLGGGQRGFRGIGRLAGLAYCDFLQFETRQSAKEPVCVVEWSGRSLREQTTIVTGHERLSDSLKRIANVYKRPATPGADPARFFRAKMINVHRFHSDLLMDVKGLRNYLAQTAPVPFDIEKFGYFDGIVKYLKEMKGFRYYHLLLNGTPVFRPYETVFQARERVVEAVSSVEYVECVRNGQLLCRGWYAVTEFLASLPPHITMRGLRVRQGNIAIGDEYFLKDQFSEPRFSTWHIGELHVSPNLKLNARRDGFEESPEYEQFREWTDALCRYLSSLARKSSSKRSTQQNANRVIKEIEEQLEVSFFVDTAHVEAFLERIGKKMGYLKRISNDANDENIKKLVTFEKRMQKIKDSPSLLVSIVDGRALKNKNNKELLIELCGRIRDIKGEKESEMLIASIVSPYLKTSMERKLSI